MNRLSKYLRASYLSLSLALLFAIATPVIVYAQGSNDNKSQENHAQTASQTETHSDFCSKLSGDETTVKHDLNDRKGKKDTAEDQRSKDIASDRAKWDQELKDSRAKWDAQRQADFAKLEAKATTPAQTAAVKAYETTITNAITTRRKANDAARASFHASVDSAIAAQKNAVNNQTTGFITAVNTAIATAKTSCAANSANAATIRTTLQAALKTARETFTNNRKSDSGLAATIKQFEQTRNAAFKANDAAFEATAKAAREALKTAFGSTSI